MSESLLFAIIIGFTVYLFMRRMRLLKQQRQQPPPTNGNASVEEPGTMPRIGQPGTVTREQIRRLRDNNFEPSRVWSREEAQLVLDSVTYLRAAIYMSIRQESPPIEVQNHLLRLILTDDDLREYVREWGLNRTREDESTVHPVLDRDEAYAKLETAIRELWED